MPLGYGYGNARLRVMRSRLLGRASYSDLLSCLNFEELVASLRQTPYKDDVERAMGRGGGVRCILEALRANLTATLLAMRGFFEGEPLRLLDLLLRRWDRSNLLAILRGQSRRLPAETVWAALVPAGQIDAVALRELARQPGLRAALDLMAAWKLPYAAALRKVRARNGPVASLDQLELALSRHHYASLAQAAGEGDGNRTILLDRIRTEVDILNISAVLRLARLPGVATLLQQRRMGAAAHPLLIEPAGTLPVERLEDLLARGDGVDGVVRGLSDSRYGAPLQAGWARTRAGAGSSAAIERELERWQVAAVAALFVRNPLGIGVAAAFLTCKEAEIANLRWIARSVAVGLGHDQAQRELILAKE